MHGGEFFTTRDVLTIVIGHRATPKKRGAVQDKLFPDFKSRRGAARHGAAQRGAACSVAPAMTNS